MYNLSSIKQKANWQLIALAVIFVVTVIGLLMQSPGSSSGTMAPIDRSALVGENAARNKPLWIKNASPAPTPNGLPKIAIVITGLGINPEDTNWAMAYLPPEIALSVVPHSKYAQYYSQLTRQGGHELLFSIPMEPIEYPNRDPGVNLLLTGVSPATNAKRMNLILRQSKQAVGFINYMGSRFLTSPGDVEEIFKMLHKSGHLFLESRNTLRSVARNIAKQTPIPFAQTNINLDTDPDMLEESLSQLVRSSKVNGFAIGVATGNIQTLKTIKNWITQNNNKGVQLVPISVIYREMYTGSKK